MVGPCLDVLDDAFRFNLFNTCIDHTGVYCGPDHCTIVSGFAILITVALLLIFKFTRSLCCARDKRSFEQTKAKTKERKASRNSDSTKQAMDIPKSSAGSADSHPEAQSSADIACPVGNPSEGADSRSLDIPGTPLRAGSTTSQHETTDIADEGKQTRSRFSEPESGPLDVAQERKQTSRRSSRTLHYHNRRQVFQRPGATDSGPGMVQPRRSPPSTRSGFHLPASKHISLETSPVVPQDCKTPHQRGPHRVLTHPVISSPLSAANPTCEQHDQYRPIRSPTDRCRPGGTHPFPAQGTLNPDAKKQLRRAQGPTPHQSSASLQAVSRFRDPSLNQTSVGSVMLPNRLQANDPSSFLRYPPGRHNKPVYNVPALRSTGVAPPAVLDQSLMAEISGRSYFGVGMVSAVTSHDECASLCVSGTTQFATPPSSVMPGRDPIAD